MQFELSLDYLEQLKSAIAKKDDRIIKAQLEELYAVDIALILLTIFLSHSISIVCLLLGGSSDKTSFFNLLIIN